MKANHLILFTVFLIQFLNAKEPSDPLTKICIGSCHRVGYNTQIWDRIGEQKPELFIFMGDNIYSDTHDPEQLKKEYNKLNQLKEYAAFKENTPIIATWDDHDYGINDEGEENPIREQARDIVLDAFSVPQNAEVRSREGLFQSYYYGASPQRLQIILLDTRYFRSPLVMKDKVYQPITGEDITLLGAAQWKWLDEELSKPADLRFIVTSIQYLNSGHRFEKWANMPDEYTKFENLLKKHKIIDHTILLSGDRHLSEISKKTFDDKSELWEITSSGLSKGGGGWKDKNPWSFCKLYQKRSFGSLAIDWDKKDISVKLLDIDAKVVREANIPFGE